MQWHSPWAIGSPKCNLSGKDLFTVFHFSLDICHFGCIIIMIRPSLALHLYIFGCFHDEHVVHLRTFWSLSKPWRCGWKNTWLGKQRFTIEICLLLIRLHYEYILTMELKLLDSLPVLIRSFTSSAKKFDVLPNYWVPFFLSRLDLCSWFNRL